ncbi:MAG: type IV pilin-like G/H family protein [Cyanobacteriota bacterium]|nr:type IV pilin-like G/H family protein [Cyanobacteriota bacterium]
MSKQIELPLYQPPSHPKKGLTSLGFWTRFIIYNCVVSAVILPIYRTDWVENLTFSKPKEMRAIQRQGQDYIVALKNAQQNYFLQKSKFTESIEELNEVIDISAKPENYEFQMWIVPEKGPFQGDEARAFAEVFIVAIPREPGFKSYSSAVSAPQEGRTSFQVCETEQPSQIPPIPTRIALNCPPGSKSRYHRL